MRVHHRSLEFRIFADGIADIRRTELVVRSLNDIAQRMGPRQRSHDLGASDRRLQTRRHWSIVDFESGRVHESMYGAQLLWLL